MPRGGAIDHGTQNRISQTATATLSNVSDPGHGTHAVLASYPGDLAFATSTSATIELTATPANSFPTTLSLTSTQSSSSFNTPITFTATLSPYSSSDGYSITFVSRGQSIGTGTLSAGVATLTVSSLPPGTNTVTATFPGDNNFAPATSNTLTQSVQASPIISLAIASDGSPVTTVTAGTIVTLTATFTSNGTPLNAGQVAFCDGSTPFCTDIHLLGTAQVLPNGTASLKFIPGRGTHSYKAVATLTGLAFPSCSLPLTVTAGPFSTTADLAASTDPSGTTLTATVTGAGGIIPLTGTVDFTDNSGYHLGTPTLGAGTITQHASPVGTYPIAPSASGAKIANYTVTATNGALTITQVGTSTTFALSNQNTTLTATVTSLTSGVPTGSVTFSEGQTPGGTGKLVNGTATVTTPSFPAGNVVLTAQYSGDANFTQSASPPIFILAVTPANTSLSVPQTGTVTDAFTISPAPGYTGTVQFSCSNLPPNATCSFQPSSVTFTGSNPTASVTATIHTGVGTQLALLAHPATSAEGRGGLLVAGLFCPGIFAFLDSPSQTPSKSSSSKPDPTAAAIGLHGHAVHRLR